MNISALDENGKAVDWWFAYKVPKLAKSADSPTATGYEYIYYDPNVGKVAKSPYLLTDGKGALDLTLKSVFGKPDATTGWILYNDEMPSDAKRLDSSSFGHTKGVIAFDTASKTALWLLHSWPKFADPARAEMPTPIYGQTYLCLSLDLATASKIADQMANHQEPQVYVPRIPASLDKTDPLYLLTQTLDPNATGDADVIDCKSRGGLAFKVIAKNRKWNKDFWNDLVGPTLKADMDVETWIRGKIPPTLDSDGIHKTFDVKYHRLESARRSLDLAGNPRSRQMGDHGRFRLGLRRRHQPDGLAGETRRRHDRVPGAELCGRPCRKPIFWCAPPGTRGWTRAG